MLATRLIETIQNLVWEHGDFEIELPNGKPITRVTMLEPAPTRYRRKTSVKPLCGGVFQRQRCVFDVGHDGPCSFQVR